MIAIVFTIISVAIGNTDQHIKNISLVFYAVAFICYTIQSVGNKIIDNLNRKE